MFNSTTANRRRTAVQDAAMAAASERDRIDRYIDARIGMECADVVARQALAMGMMDAHMAAGRSYHEHAATIVALGYNDPRPRF